ncbi:MAG: coiled-coil protein [Candidatus Heimdallarchaeaceae archaeon]
MSVESEEMSLEEKKEHLGSLRLKRKEFIDKLRGCNEKRNEIRSSRDQKNKQAKDLFNEAKTSKEQRDKINEEVQVRKQMRDILREDADKIAKRLVELGSQMKNVGIPRNKRVGEKIRRLERQLETTPFLTKEMEKTTLNQLEELSAEFEKIEQFKDLRSEVRDIQNKLRYMQTEIKTYHTSVTTLAQESQIHQEKMIAATKEARKIKEEADTAHSEVIAFSIQITEIRKTLDGLTQEVKKLSNEFGIELHAVRKARRVEAKRARDEKLDARAEEILVRFKDGNKLTLDEFKVLMERGLI